jgi:hypothetical protein
MSQLIFLKHLRLDKRLESVDLAISLLLYEFDFSKGTFSNDFERGKIRRYFFGSKESKKLGFGTTNVGFLLFLSDRGDLGICKVCF